MTIEIPAADKPRLEGDLGYTLSSDGTTLKFEVQHSTQETLNLETSDKSLKVCLVPSNNVGAQPTAPVKNTPVSPAAGQPTTPPASGPQPPGKGATGTPSTSPSSAGNQKIDFASLDLSPPESPAFTVLGLTPQTVVRPNTPQELASTLINGIDQNGNFQTGIAIDTAPYMLFAGNSVTLYQYNHSWITRFLARSQVSFATTKGANEADKSVRISLGARLTLWDRGDSRTDQAIITCFTSIDVSLPPIHPVPTPEDLKNIAKANAEFEAGAQKCRDASRKRNWNSSSWIVAAAPVWTSPDGSTSAFRLDGGGAWTSFAYGFERVPGLDQHAQLIVSGRIRNNESVPDPNNKGSFLRQNSTIIGGRLRFGSESFNGNFEGVYISKRQPTKPRDNSYRISIGAERRIASNLWLDLSFGRDSSSPTTPSHLSFLSNLTWHFSPKANDAFGPPK
jgi:hypothetical protein